MCYNKDAMINRTAPFFNILIGALVCLNFLFFADYNALGQAKNDYAADEILVKFKDSSEIITIKLAQSRDFLAVLNYYQKLPFIDYAEPNYIYKAAIIPSDTFFGNQWYLQKIKATTAWNDIRESPNVTIDVLDSGVEIDHPDLVSNIWTNK